VLALKTETDPRWLERALADFDAVLIDHAHAEKKAAASAMALVSAYPERNVLVRRCVKVAQEELRHFQKVHEILVARGVELTRDRGDPYVKRLLACVRKGQAGQLTDRLLVAALVEARSCERLQLLGEALADESLARFYTTLAKSEAGHFTLFRDLAALYDDPTAVEARLEELATSEAEIVADLPIEPRIH
jgi:tRNA-(ms[2]io[6]A)-hydroxylase